MEESSDDWETVILQDNEEKGSEDSFERNPYRQYIGDVNNDDLPPENIKVAFTGFPAIASFREASWGRRRRC